MRGALSVANEAGAPDVAALPGGRRALGHALEFGRDPLGCSRQ